MTATNLIFQPPATDPVSITITGIKTKAGDDITLNDFSKITAIFKGDSRNSVDNPTSVVVVSDTELELYFMDTTETNCGYWTIRGTYNSEERVLTNACKDNLDSTRVC